MTDQTDTSAGASGSLRSGSRRTAMRFVERWALLVILVLVLIYFSVAATDFANMANLRVVLASESVLITVALAASLPLLVGEFDLSVVAIMGTATVVTGGLLSNSHWPLLLAVLAGVASGALIGAFNGLLVTRVGVNSLILTLGVSTILPGLVTWYTNGLTIVSGIPASLSNATNDLFLGLPRSIWFVAIIALAVWYLTTQIPWGRRTGAIGSNKEAARLIGIRTDRTVFVMFVFSGVLCGIAGVLLLARQGSADPQASAGGLLLPALAAVFLGSTAYTPGRYNVPGTVTAALFVAFSVSGLTLMGAAAWVEQVFNGVALVVAVTLSTLAAKGGGAVIPRRRPRAPANTVEPEQTPVSDEVATAEAAPAPDTTPQH
jgi:ribose transport system permease protein